MRRDERRDACAVRRRPAVRARAREHASRRHARARVPICNNYIEVARARIPTAPGGQWATTRVELERLRIATGRDGPRSERLKVAIVGMRRLPTQLVLLVAVLAFAGDEAFTQADETSGSWAPELVSEPARQLEPEPPILSPTPPPPLVGRRPDWFQPIGYEDSDGTPHIWVSTLDADCAGFFSDCTTSCERAALRIWTERVAQRGGGSACPTAQDCAAGEGDCVDLPPSLSSNSSARVDSVDTRQDGSNGSGLQTWSNLDLVLLAFAAGVAVTCVGLLVCVVVCPRKRHGYKVRASGRRENDYARLTQQNRNDAGATATRRDTAKPHREPEPEPEPGAEQGPNFQLEPLETVIEPTPIEEGIDTSIGEWPIRPSTIQIENGQPVKMTG